MNIKRFIILLFIVAFQAGKNHNLQNTINTDVIQVYGVATASDCFTLENGKQIKVYNDTLQVNETYIIILDIVNDYEPINYIDLEVYELENGI